jgi:thymidylate synthase
VSHTFQCHRLSTSYKQLVQHVVRDGDLVQSRVGNTMEMLGFHLELCDPCECVVRREKFNRDLMDAEVAMILGGVFDEELIKLTTPKVADLVGASTAYGPRISAQMDVCAKELDRDIGSRRAVAYIGRPTDLIGVLLEDSAMLGEMPCTECLQFIVRDHRLHMCVSMRSWDLVWGMSYDVPMFVSLQMAMAAQLGVHIGRYYHFAGSAHVYEHHWNIRIEDNFAHGRLAVPYLADTLQDTAEGARKHIERMKRKKKVKA